MSDNRFDTRTYPVTDAHACDLIGLKLTSFCFGIASQTLVFERFGDGKCDTYECSSAYEICLNEADIFKKDIAGDPSVSELWSFLERDLTDIEVSKACRVARLGFNNAKSLYLWNTDKLMDNLIIVRHQQSDLWFTIG